MRIPPPDGPIFAICPADVRRVPASADGGSLRITPSGLLVALGVTALEIRLDPTVMMALSVVLFGAGHRLGGAWHQHEQVPDGPVFDRRPAEVAEVPTSLTGGSLCVTTFGLLVAHGDTALSVRLAPTPMMALAVDLGCVGDAHGGDGAAAMQFLMRAPSVEASHAH